MIDHSHSRHPALPPPGDAVPAGVIPCHAATDDAIPPGIVSDTREGRDSGGCHIGGRRALWAVIVLGSGWLLWMAAILTAAHAEPYTLVTIWPSGHVKNEPAATRASCELAMTDALDGFALPLDEMLPATAAHCEKRDSFPKGWDVIPGYNAPRRK